METIDPFTLNTTVRTVAILEQHASTLIHEIPLRNPTPIEINSPLGVSCRILFVHKLLETWSCTLQPGSVSCNLDASGIKLEKVEL